jgi:hypothetical protein
MIKTLPSVTLFLMQLTAFTGLSQEGRVDISDYMEPGDEP